MKIKFKYYLLVGLFFVSTLIFALDTWDSGFRVNNNTTKAVSYTSSNLCKRVSNSTGNNIFVGTKTSEEINSVVSNPNISLSNCSWNVALNRYIHSSSYNNKLNTGTDCDDKSWAGLTDGKISTTSNAECKKGSTWAGGVYGQNEASVDKYVSLGLSKTYKVNKVKVYAERGPLGANIQNCSGSDNNTKYVYLYVKDSSDCRWNTTGWSLIGGKTASSSGGSILTFNFTERNVRCVKLKFKDNWRQWRDCEGLGDRGYVFLRELEVYGY